MLALPPVFLLAIYIFSYIVGTVVPRLRLVIVLSAVTLIGYSLYENFNAIYAFLIGMGGQHLLVFGYAVALGVIMGGLNVKRSFNLLFIIMPLSLIFLLSTHLLMMYLSLSALLFYLFIQTFGQAKEDFRNSIVMLCVCLIALTLYSVLSAVSFTSEQVGTGFVVYELTATLAFVSLLIVTISFASLLTQYPFVRKSALSTELLIVIPTVLFKLLILCQSVFVLLEVSMQEQLFGLLKWLIGAALVLLGLAALNERDLEKLSKVFYLSIFSLVANLIFTQPSVELYLPVYLLLVLGVFFYLYANEESVKDNYLCQRWVALSLAYLPLTAIPLSMFVFVRIILSDGLVLSSFFILGNFGLLISAAVMFLMTQQMNDRAEESNLKLPIRTFFLISCTLLSTCLLVLS